VAAVRQASHSTHHLKPDFSSFPRDASRVPSGPTDSNTKLVSAVGHSSDYSSVSWVALRYLVYVDRIEHKDLFLLYKVDKLVYTKLFSFFAARKPSND
jgi:hypothetical protein